MTPRNPMPMAVRVARGHARNVQKLIRQLNIPATVRVVPMARSAWYDLAARNGSRMVGGVSTHHVTPGGELHPIVSNAERILGDGHVTLWTLYSGRTVMVIDGGTVVLVLDQKGRE